MRFITLFFSIIVCTISANSQNNILSDKEIVFDLETKKDQIILDGKELDNVMHLLYFKDTPTFIKAMEEELITCKLFETDIQRCLLKY